jgi:hypothetical protein
VIINSENRAVAKRLPTLSFYDLIEPIGLSLDQKDRTGFDRITLHDCPKSGKPHAYSQPRRCVRCETLLCKVSLVTFSAYLFSPINLRFTHQITSNRNARTVFASIAILFPITRQQRTPRKLLGRQTHLYSMPLLQMLKREPYTNIAAAAPRLS